MLVGGTRVFRLSTAGYQPAPLPLARATSPSATTRSAAPTRSQSTPGTTPPTALPPPTRAGSKARTREAIPDPNRPEDDRSSACGCRPLHAARRLLQLEFRRKAERPPPLPGVKLPRLAL